MREGEREKGKEERGKGVQDITGEWKREKRERDKRNSRRFVDGTGRRKGEKRRGEGGGDKTIREWR